MVPGGTVQSARILNLCPTKCYWIGLRVFDPVDGCSDLSEILAITTRSRPTPSPLVEVPAGKFVMGSGPEEFAPEEESPETVLDLAAFAIEATEVTNAQYAVFMEEGGDARPEYWSDAGWVWRESNGITRPLFWDSGVYRCGLAEVRCTIRNAAGTCPCD
jgi:formylglycine-generating enzyme required for sulfatase activity